ncbi:hypothetical protein [Streptomyces clavuligerus]|uniref:hypothetical protein n=1 Tax=Streptomyces clavuligerus TaxID=1901 RepID=UPI00017FF4C2|nr:hypothetical protein [Streptomyces clavuligerus]AXU16809.1 hypothetical protein D1794_29000 [Streptomyces clavuligerus]EDY48787.1 conserved hypothetical protein [Streptomyces clavuligerus]MBY6300942.1 hypothetical protein [Streptomyces clavuligerus]QPJ97044.1 hypothetical protein GE265_28455 [Streptomyces clavuligerus]WDN55753.1 hypothetical protein LL058_28040 [Streptomyces clavuligerus]
MATTITPLQPGTEAAAQALADFIFGSDIPPIAPDDYDGSWRTTLHVIAEEWVGEGRVHRHAARTATAAGSSAPPPTTSAATARSSTRADIAPARRERDRSRCPSDRTGRGRPPA